MLLAHAIALCEARSYLAALADTARTVEGSIAYERVLLQLDLVHNDQAPAHQTLSRILPTAELCRLAVTSIEALVGHGVDALDVELVIAALIDAFEIDHALDGRKPGTP